MDKEKEAEMKEKFALDYGDKEGETSTNDPGFILDTGEEPTWLDRLEQLHRSGIDTDVIEAGASIKDGYNSIMDTFYVLPPTGGTWKEDASWRDGLIAQKKENSKIKLEQEQNAYVNNEDNIEFKIQSEGLMERARELYPNKSEAYQRDWAEQKAKEMLKDESIYVKYGITDPAVAGELRRDQKRYGLTPQQAIKQRYRYERDNNDPANVQAIKDSFARQIRIAYPGDITRQTTEINNFNESVHTVSDAIPDYKEMHYQGFSSMNDAYRISILEQKLDITTSQAMKVHSALQKKGDITPKAQGKNESNEHYAERLKRVEEIRKMYNKDKKDK